jgi:hypothetical protein
MHSYNTIPRNDGYAGSRIEMTIEKAEPYNMMRDPGERFIVIEYYPEKVKELMEILLQVFSVFVSRFATHPGGILYANTVLPNSPP